MAENLNAGKVFGRQVFFEQSKHGVIFRIASVIYDNDCAKPQAEELLREVDYLPIRLPDRNKNSDISELGGAASMQTAMKNLCGFTSWRT